MRAASAAVSESSSPYIDQYNQYNMDFGQGTAFAAALAGNSAARPGFAGAALCYCPARL
jgi:hypothetical protein